MLLKTLALAGLLAASAIPALAQTTPPAAPMAPATGDAAARPAPSPAMVAARAKMREMCAADMKTYCADAQAGGGAMMQCMRENSAKMSDPCKAAMSEMRAARSGG